MLLKLADKTFSAREGSAGIVSSRLVRGKRMSLGLFSAENPTVTVGSLDRRAVDHKHE